MGAYLALGIHANAFFGGLTPGETQTVTLGLFAGLVVGAPLAAPLMRRFEKAQILAAGMAGMALAQAGPALLRLAGLLPLEGGALATTLALAIFARSEEHTSELQSLMRLSYAVFCLNKNTLYKQ